MLPEVLSHLVAPENNRNFIILSHPVQQAKENAASKGVSVSEVIGRPFSKGVQKTSNLRKFRFANQSFIVFCGMPSREGEK